MILTSEILKNICPDLDRSQLISDAINKVIPLYKMDTSLTLTHFIPNLLVECQEFTRFEEGLNYQSVALMKLFSRERISMAQCVDYGRTGTHKANQQVIANTIYGGEWGKRNLGNKAITDGYDFKGSGILQCTGRDEHQQFINYYNRKFGTNFTLYDAALLLRNSNNLEINLHFGCWFFTIYKNIIPLIVADNFKEVVRKVNGGYNGLDERMVYYNRCKQFLV